MSETNQKYAATRPSGVFVNSGRDEPINRGPIIQEHLDALEKELNALGEAVDKHGNKITPVMRKLETKSPEDSEKAQTVPVPLAEQIRVLSNQAYTIRRTIEWFTSRVEV